METAAVEPIVEMRGISKSFGGTRALSDVDLVLRPGCVHGLIGENGAGKSTLIKILAGAYQRDSGTVVVSGEEITTASPHAMLARGVSVIYQEFMLAPDLSVAENMFIEHLHGRLPIIRWRELHERTRSELDAVGFGHLDPRTLVRHLTVAEQQIVEICKALARRSRVIVFDEPTAVLTHQETRTLLDLIRTLREDGVAIVYVSHRLDELFEICDEITVLKDGVRVATTRVAEVTQPSLVQMMVGRDLEQMFPQRDHRPGRELVRVQGLSSGTRVKDASFHVRAGEVVGFAGLVGSGRTELMRAVYGADPTASGTVSIEGARVPSRSPRSSIARGIGFVPEDRKGQGLALEQSIRFNAGLVRNSTNGYINPAKDRRFARDLLARISTRYSSLEDPVSSLSGGNQQKVSLAKWLAADLNLLIFDEPTRGVDIGAKAEIYKIVDTLARDGFGIILISSELPEIVGLSDRVYVMHEGHVVAHLTGENISEATIVDYVMGIKRENAS